MLRMLGIFLLGVVHSTPSPKLSYEDAYQIAARDEKILLVVVGAEWCAACQKLKDGTLDPMEKSGKLDCVVMAQVDKDKQPELAKQIMSGNTLPQLIAFRQTQEGWKRFSLAGNQSENRVAELLRAASQQSAAATQPQ